MQYRSVAAVHGETGADPEMLHGGWLPVLYYTELRGWLANNDRLTPIVLCVNEQVKGGWLATPSTPPPPPSRAQPLYRMRKKSLVKHVFNFGSQCKYVMWDDARTFAP